MNYYKLIDGINVIGACSSSDLRRFQQKHGILLACDEDSAQYIQLGEKLYRDQWFKKTITDLFPYVLVKVVSIEQQEYEILAAALDSGDDIIDDDSSSSSTPTAEEDIHELDPDMGITVDFVKKSKLAELSSACNHAITDGIDIVLSDGKTHHFSLTVQDQLNLISLSSMISAGEKTIPYHADGELCKLFSVSDIQSVITSATEFKTFHVTYYNSLKAYVEAMNSIEVIANVHYGDSIPEEYQSDILKMLINGNYSS